MTFQLAEAGAVDDELARDVNLWWQEAAEKCDINLAKFDSAAPLDERVAWALEEGLEIGTVYSRFSSKRQHSTADQVRTCVQHAASKAIYCPPELVSADEAQRGYRARREGLERMRAILGSRAATVLMVFKASRLYRQAFKGYQLIQQDVVEEGLRAISVTQGIDTADTKAWRMLFQVHGMVDDMVIEATADHVRAGLKGLFARGYTVGALPVGYRRRELLDAPTTNRGLPRTVPEVDPDVAEIVRQHFQLIRDGMPIRRCWTKWVAGGGPADPRSTLGHMTYQAYRRLLSRVAYTGRFEFGRKRNEFSTRRDYARQIEQPDSEVEVVLCEELRIVDDELFFAVQRQLAELKTGPRGPRNNKAAQLWDLVTDLFWCPHCNVRYYQTGARGQGMQCKNGDLCSSRSAVNRQEAVGAVCEHLSELVRQDAELVEQTICRSAELDAEGDQQLEAELSRKQRAVASLSAKINDLYELAGQGNDRDRKEVMAKVRAAQAERAAARHELSRLQGALGAIAAIRPQDVRKIIAELKTLLERAAAGQLGPEAVYKAVSVFRRLVGGRIWVHVERRPGRKHTNVRGVFTPDLIGAAADSAGQRERSVGPASDKVSVWLREPPLRDRLAPKVHELIDQQGHSYRSAAKVLQAEGCNVNSGVVWQIYRRYYEMIGRPVPERPYNSGLPRSSV